MNNKQRLYYLMLDYMMMCDTSELLMRFWSTFSPLIKDLDADLRERIIKRKDEIKKALEDHEFYKDGLKKGVL